MIWFTPASAAGSVSASACSSHTTVLIIGIFHGSVDFIGNLSFVIKTKRWIPSNVKQRYNDETFIDKYFKVRTSIIFQTFKWLLMRKKKLVSVIKKRENYSDLLPFSHNFFILCIHYVYETFWNLDVYFQLLFDLFFIFLKTT